MRFLSRKEMLLGKVSITLALCFIAFGYLALNFAPGLFARIPLQLINRVIIANYTITKSMRAL